MSRPNRHNYEVRRLPRSIAEIVEEFQDIATHLRNRVRLRGVFDDTRVHKISPPPQVGDLLIVRDTSKSSPTYEAWLILSDSPRSRAAWPVTVEKA